MTDDLAVYERIAAALADGREPDLSDLPLSDVRAALEHALLYTEPRHQFAVWLDTRVRALSGDKSSIEELPAATGFAPELSVRLIVQGEPFSEPVVVRVDDPVVEFPMRG